MEEKQELRSEEIQRKLLHLSSVWVPLLYLFMGQMGMLLLLVVVTIAVVVVDNLRTKNPDLQRSVHKIFGGMMRETEKTGEQASGTSYFMFGALVTVFLFPKSVAITALLVLILCDTAAAWVGQRWGRMPFMGKTMEGTAAFLGVGLLVVMFMAWWSGEGVSFYVAGLLGLIAAAAAELFSTRIRVNDNLSIPLAMGIVMTLAGYI